MAALCHPFWIWVFPEPGLWREQEVPEGDSSKHTSMG